MKKFVVDNINDYFESHIIQRGYKYFKTGHVKDASYNKNTVNFVVNGNVPYEVEIKFTKKGYEMTCDCPYYIEHNQNCKHMVACLFYLKFNEIEEKEKKSKPKQIDDFKYRIKQDIRYLYGKEGYIDYYTGDEFVDMIEKYTTEASYEEKNKKIEHIFYLYDVIDKVEMDGSNGEHFMAISIVSEELNVLFNVYPEDITKKLLNMTKQKLEIIDISEIIAEIHPDNKNIDNYINLISEIQNALEESHDEYRNYQVDYLEYLYIKALYKKDREKAIKLAISKINNSHVLDFLLKTYEEEKNYKAAILLLEKGRYNGWDKHEKLLKLYHLNKDTKKYREKLYEIYQKAPTYDLYKDLKKELEPHEFSKIHDKLLRIAYEKSRGEYNNTFIKICLEEKLTDELFKYCKENGIELLDKYLNKFNYKYHKEIIKYYHDEIIKKCDVARNQARYDEISYYMFRLLDLKGSKSAVMDIINYVKENYPTRLKFIEEITNIEKAI